MGLFLEISQDRLQGPNYIPHQTPTKLHPPSFAASPWMRAQPALADRLRSESLSSERDSANDGEGCFCCLLALCSLEISYNCLASLVKILFRVYIVIATNGCCCITYPGEKESKKERKSQQTYDCEYRKQIFPYARPTALPTYLGTYLGLFMILSACFLFSCSSILGSEKQY
ncbi:hypothetical protein F4814DRAFT_373665 [Daldinia grandis]|nr:hypothetical protein F4814DRAFT_373665 [Daldinia grandis]